ncbi:hypothetical protein GCM10009414_29940 [Tatumella terrea]|uniref:HNH endonuclease n=1 Tax=Tatumella terrea TaxID=419007 RepID=UPI0031CDC7D3
MGKLIFDRKDVEAIRLSILEDGDVWKNPKLIDLKNKIKKYYKDKCVRCCYCQRSFRGEFNLVIDIEHILPKSVFKQYMFTPKNLSIACKRCNMKIKKASMAFIELDFHRRLIFNKKYYKFIHPNLDVYKKHIMRINVEVGDLAFTKYNVVNNSEKGSYTYNFFKLYEFEIQNFDLAQGLPVIEKYI